MRHFEGYTHCNSTVVGSDRRHNCTGMLARCGSDRRIILGGIPGRLLQAVAGKKLVVCQFAELPDQA